MFLFVVNDTDILQGLMRPEDVFKKPVLKHFEKVRFEGSLWGFFGFRDGCFPETKIV